jgi:hypothetical protein
MIISSPVMRPQFSKPMRAAAVAKSSGSSVTLIASLAAYGGSPDAPRSRGLRRTPTRRLVGLAHVATARHPDAFIALRHVDHLRLAPDDHPDLSAHAIPPMKRTRPEPRRCGSVAAAGRGSPKQVPH